jgi:hypothetical protein
MQELLRLRDEGKLNEDQKQWFRDHKPKEELFDCSVDPFELNNLANHPEYQDKLNELSTEMDKWLETIADNPDLPEGELIKKLWNGNNAQPSTSDPIITNNNGKVTINCETKGASIGFKVVKNGEKAPKSWEVYKSAIDIPKGAKLLVQAHRIGFRPSSVIEIQ